MSLLLLAIFSHFLSNRESGAAKSIRLKYGIPHGRVIYSDLDRPAKALFSKKLGISGKPDYIISDKRYGGLIPIEIKSGRAAKPYRNHVLQLAAYCLLVEETYHKSVPYGIIVYADGKQNKIIFDEPLRSDLIGVVKEMKQIHEIRMPDERSRSEEKMQFLFVSGELQVLFGLYLSDPVRFSLAESESNMNAIQAELSLSRIP